MYIQYNEVVYKNKYLDPTPRKKIFGYTNVNTLSFAPPLLCFLQLTWNSREFWQPTCRKIMWRTLTFQPTGPSINEYIIQTLVWARDLWSHSLVNYPLKGLLWKAYLKAVYRRCGIFDLVNGLVWLAYYSLVFIWEDLRFIICKKSIPFHFSAPITFIGTTMFLYFNCMRLKPHSFNWQLAFKH